MVQENELYVGKWYEHDGEWSAINDINNNGKKSNSPFYFQFSSSDWSAVGECTLSLEQISGIPLTPDILVKCGFHKDNYGVYEKVKDNQPYISGCEIELWTSELNGVWEFYVGISIESLFKIAELKCLHQLQNLIFSMSCTELTYNP